MSCNLCGSTFSVFKKEYSCRKCGFSFCGKCCCKKIILPELGPSKQLVCLRCFENLTRSKDNIAPTAATSAIPAIPKSHHRITSSEVTPAHKFEGLSKEDTELLRRLDKLKENAIKPTTSEIEARLARLKDIDPEKKPITIYKSAKPLTQIEQADKLLQQMKEENFLDNLRPTPEQEITERLQRLRGNTNELDRKIQNTSEVSQEQNDLNKGGNEISDGASCRNIDVDEVNSFLQKLSHEANDDAKKHLQSLNQDSEVQECIKKLKKQKPQASDDKVNFDVDGYSSEDNDDDEKEANRLIQQLIAESKLEDDLEKAEVDFNSFYSDKKQNSHQSKMSFKEEDEELPWCSICNENAKLRCHDCDGDLYCRRCFKSCHDEFGLSDHTSSSYKGAK